MRKTIWTGTCVVIVGIAAAVATAQTSSPQQTSSPPQRMSKGGASNFRAVERPDGSHWRCRCDGNNRHGGNNRRRWNNRRRGSSRCRRRRERGRRSEFRSDERDHRIC